MLGRSRWACYRSELAPELVTEAPSRTTAEPNAAAWLWRVGVAGVAGFLPPVLPELAEGESAMLRAWQSL